MRAVPPAINHIDFGTHESWIVFEVKILNMMWKYLKYQATLGNENESCMVERSATHNV